MATLCVGTQCHKEDIVYKYSFLEKIDLFPTQKSYSVGDTIWLQYANPSKKLYDNGTGQYILADTVSITFQVTLNSRYNAPFNPADGYCDFITPNGINLDRYLDTYGTGLLSTFGCSSNNSNDFKIGVILKQKGIYSLDLAEIPRSVAGCVNRISAFPLSTKFTDLISLMVPKTFSFPFLQVPGVSQSMDLQKTKLTIKKLISSE